MRHIYFTSCFADPYAWMRTAKKSDGTSYYEYILLYTDDKLVVIQHSEETLGKDFGRYFGFKEGSIVPPKI